jgi:hypothetical protein
MPCWMCCRCRGMAGAMVLQCRDNRSVREAGVDHDYDEHHKHDDEHQYYDDEHSYDNDTTATTTTTSVRDYGDTSDYG